MADERASQRSGRHAVGRWLPGAVLAVLVVVAFAAFLAVRRAVDDQNGRILRERTGEIGLLLKSAVGAIPASMSGLGVATRLGDSPSAAFLSEARRQTALAGTESIALVRRTRGRPTVVAVAGLPTLAAGDILTGPRAAAVDRAIATGQPVATRVLGLGGGHVIGFALGPPATAAGTAIYLQAPIDPAAAAQGRVASQRPFDDLAVALYAAPRADVSQLVLATGPARLHGQVASQQIAVGGRRWLLAAAARTPLVGTFANAVPWVILVVGLAIALVSSCVLVVFQRRRDYALALVDVRTAELETSMRELSETQARLVFQERLAAIGQVAAAVGHELRNPLGVLTNTLYLLRSGLSDAETERLGRHLDRADREIGAAVVIVESLLEFARAHDPVDEPVDLADLVAESLSVAPPPAGIEVVHVGLDGIEPVRADHQQLRQVLLNLLTNSYQAIGGEGVVTVAAGRSAGGFDLTVSDTGAGMDEETANHVFDAFYTRKAKGIGLGLAVTKRIVEAHGGTITARSQAGVGTTFVVSIPQTPAAERVPS